MNGVEDAEVSFPGHESWREFYSRDSSLMEVMKAHLPHAHELRANPAAHALNAAYVDCASTHAT